MTTAAPPTQAADRDLVHAFTVDVEDYDNITLRDMLELNHNLPPTAAVVRDTAKVLELLAVHAVHGTFFVLGEVAEAFPHVVRDIAAAGHELGVHGYYHNLITQLTPDAFRREVRDAKRRIEDVAQQPVRGHRAPVFTVIPRTRWALDVLAEEGYAYDSSIFPFAGRRYGWPGFSQSIHTLRLDSGRSIVEAPLTTVDVLGRRLPACGGGYLRVFPFGVTRWSFRRTARVRPAIVYIHPYELDDRAGPLDLGAAAPDKARNARRFHRRQLCNRRSVAPKLNRLLREFRFAPLADVIQQALARSDSPVRLAALPGAAPVAQG